MTRSRVRGHSPRSGTSWRTGTASRSRCTPTTARPSTSTRSCGRCSPPRATASAAATAAVPLAHVRRLDAAARREPPPLGRAARAVPRDGRRARGRVRRRRRRGGRHQRRGARIGCTRRPAICCGSPRRSAPASAGATSWPRRSGTCTASPSGAGRAASGDPRRRQEALGAAHPGARFDYVFHGSSGSSPEELRAAVANGVVKVNLDSEAQRAFTSGVAEHLFAHYDVPGGGKQAYDPRGWGAAAEASMAARVATACEQLGSAGRSITPITSTPPRAAAPSPIRSRNARASGDHSARVNAHSSRERGGSRLRAARRCGPATMLHRHERRSEAGRGERRHGGDLSRPHGRPGVKPASAHNVR